MLVKSQVKYIQSLSQKKLRDEEGLFVAEGPKIINELLAATNIKPRQIYATEGWLQSHPQLSGQSFVTAISSSELDRISLLKAPNQVTGIFEKPVFEGTASPIGKVTLLLDTIQDPGNMGTIIRCADWFGVKEIFCSEDCVDVFNPKTIQSTMGSIARVRVSIIKPVEFIQQHQEISRYAAVLNGQDLSGIKKINEGIIIIGNESKGIDPELLTGTYKAITIPKKGAAESLNAAVATGIILSHLT